MRGFAIAAALFVSSAGGHARRRPLPNPASVTVGDVARPEGTLRADRAFDVSDIEKRALGTGDDSVLEAMRLRRFGAGYGRRRDEAS
jgi:hypothetical protein